MKSKQRFLKRTAPVMTLENATDEQVFAELLKRVLIKRPAICYFVDQINSNGEWDIHAASSASIIRITKL